MGVPIDTILQNVAVDVLPVAIPIWDNGRVEDVKKAILKHYWMREIGFETVGMWKYYLGTHLQEIMPWYVDLHNRLEDMANIFITETSKMTDSLDYGHNIKKSGTDTTTISQEDTTDGSNNLTENGTDTGTVNNTGTDDVSGQNLVSDTPQNGLTDVIQGKYLSNAGVNSETRSMDNTETRNLKATRSSINDILSHLQRTGSTSLQHGMTDTHGGTDVHTILKEGFSGDKVAIMSQYVQAHLNIMQMIIKDCAKYWMGILG